LSSLTSIFHLNISLAGKGSQGQIKQNMVKMQRCQQREQRRWFTVLLNQQWKKYHQLPPNDQEMAPPGPNDQEMATTATDAVCNPTRLTADQIIQTSPIRVTRG